MVHDRGDEGKEGLRCFDPLRLWRWFWSRMEPLGQSVDLRHVKYSIGLEESERLFAVFAAGDVMHGLAAVAI